ncbi:hypothetical protein [Corynebacterium sp.]|uniref:hypothetical protein n=1 Tax=Corynebacterium sp. TaxID=1720 RepID=UPI0025BD2862|nr:hypothetical protein [Corynebacterium sp.]
MTILVTAATGHLGSLVIDRLIARGADASDIVAGVRTPPRPPTSRRRVCRSVTSTTTSPPPSPPPSRASTASC